MNKKPEVGPDLMNVINLIMFNDHLHTHLAPGRNSKYITYIPFFCMLHYLCQFLIPIFNGRDTPTRFVKTLKPERPFLLQDATKVSGIPSGFSFLQICSA